MALTDDRAAERESVLARTFVMLADTLVDDFDVVDLFDHLTAACVELLGAATAGLMLADEHGALQLMTSTSEAMRALELFEVNHDEGPCLDAFATCSALAVDLLSDEAAARWPQFTAEARRASVTVVQALPMRLRGRTIGALNIFHTTGSMLNESDTALAQAFADAATIALLQRRALMSSELLSEQLQGALNDRVVIEQVKGLLAERGQLDIDKAFEVLRQYCRAERLPLTRTAHELISGRRDPDDVLAHRWPHAPTT